MPIRVHFYCVKQAAHAVLFPYGILTVRHDMLERAQYTRTLKQHHRHRAQASYVYE